MTIANRFGQCAVVVNDWDEIVLSAVAADGWRVGVRLHAEAASQLGGELQAAAAKAVGRSHAGRTDIMHLADSCFDCGQPFQAASGGDLYCPGCRGGTKRRRVDGT